MLFQKPFRSNSIRAVVWPQNDEIQNGGKRFKLTPPHFWPIGDRSLAVIVLHSKDFW